MVHAGGAGSPCLGNCETWIMLGEGGGGEGILYEIALPRHSPCPVEASGGGILKVIPKLCKSE